MRGGSDGIEGGANVHSQCVMTPVGCEATDTCESVIKCMSCDENEGPTNGCYRAEGLVGKCDWWYWSNTYSPSSNPPYNYYAFRIGFQYGGDIDSVSGSDGSYYARCIRRR